MRALVIVLAFLLAGCAGYSVKKNGCGTGYDVYRPDPYLLRKPMKDNNGQVTGFEFEVVWLPNYSQRYRVHSWTGFGASDIKFTFTDGWKFTGLHDKSDNTQILKTLSDLTKHAIPANPFDIGKESAKQSASNNWALINESNQPVLYKIVFNECGDICGLKRFRIMDCKGPDGLPRVLPAAPRVPDIPRGGAGTGGFGEDTPARTPKSGPEGSGGTGGSGGASASASGTGTSYGTPPPPPPPLR